MGNFLYKSNYIWIKKKHKLIKKQIKMKLKKFQINIYKNIWLDSKNKLKYKFKIISNIYMVLKKRSNFKFQSFKIKSKTLASNVQHFMQSNSCK